MGLPTQKNGTSAAGRNSALVPCALKVPGLKPFAFTAQFIIPQCQRVASQAGAGGCPPVPAPSANHFEPLIHEDASA